MKAKAVDQETVTLPEESTVDETPAAPEEEKPVEETPVTPQEEEMKKKAPGPLKLILFAVCAVIFIAVGVIAGILIGRAQNEAPATFTHEGMSITLTKRFRESGKEPFYYYAPPDVTVLPVKMAFSAYESLSDCTEEEFAEQIIRSEGIEDAVVNREEGLVWYRFLSDYSGNYCYRFVYKTSDAFRIVQFSIPVTKEKEMKGDVMNWARSVTFEN